MANIVAGGMGLGFQVAGISRERFKDQVADFYRLHDIKNQILEDQFHEVTEMMEQQLSQLNNVSIMSALVAGFGFLLIFEGQPDAGSISSPTFQGTTPKRWMEIFNISGTLSASSLTMCALLSTITTMYISQQSKTFLREQYRTRFRDHARYFQQNKDLILPWRKPDAVHNEEVEQSNLMKTWNFVKDSFDNIIQWGKATFQLTLNPTTAQKDLAGSNMVQTPDANDTMMNNWVKVQKRNTSALSFLGMDFNIFNKCCGKQTTYRLNMTIISILFYIGLLSFFLSVGASIPLHFIDRSQIYPIVMFWICMFFFIAVCVFLIFSNVGLGLIYQITIDEKHTRRFLDKMKRKERERIQRQIERDGRMAINVQDELDLEKWNRVHGEIEMIENPMRERRL